MFVINPEVNSEFPTILSIVPGTPNVPTSNIPTSPFKRDCKIGIYSAFPCIFSKLCSTGAILLS